MNSMKTLPISEVYKVVTRQPVVQENGLKQYPVIKKYFDNLQEFTQKSLQLKKGKKKKNLRLRTYLDEQQKKYRNNPGPGKYNLNYDWHKPEQRNKKISNRKTYLDQIVSQMARNKSPGPGQYQTDTFTHSNSVSKLNYKKQQLKQRVFYYDQNQYIGAKVPGPGQYDISKKLNTNFRHNNQNPEKSIKKFRVKSEKRLKTLPKLPDMGTYSPQQCGFFTFQAANKVKHLKKGFGSSQRFKTLPEGSGLSPNKYGFINEWNGKDGKNKQYEKHGLDVLSKPQLRVYN